MNTNLTAAVSTPGDESRLEQLHAQLIDRALKERILDVSYRTVDSPIGGLLLAATPTGLARVAFESEGYDHVLEDLSERLSPRIMKDPKRLDAAAKEVEEYFQGDRRSFDLTLDLSLSKGFRREVLDHLKTVPFGTRVSYTELATMSGRERAVRAAASACATNPIPLVVPCHRVLRGDGSLGGYRGGLPAKRTLLALESVDA